jgi:hypothetical protein
MRARELLYTYRMSVQLELVLRYKGLHDTMRSVALDERYQAI